MATRQRRRRVVPERLTQSELERLLAAPSLRCPTGRRNHVLMRLMAHAALRCDEALQLRAADVRDAELRVQGKGGKARVVPLDRDTEHVLRAWLAERPASANGRVFTTLGGRPLSTRYVRAMLEREAEAADVPLRRRTAPSEANPEGTWSRAWPHLLRHTGASMALEGSLPGQTRPLTLEEVRAWLGHSHLTTTSIYLHADTRAMREALRGEPEPEDEVAALKAQLAALTERLARVEAKRGA